MKHEDAMHACENREEREYEKTGVTDTGERLEVLKIAVIYGADAVYIGGEAFGLRAKAKNFPWKRSGGIALRMP